MSKERHVVVIGAGAGGLAAAVDLSRSGFRVTLIESAATVGGKMNQVTVGDQSIDTGPTVFTMRWVFDGLFNDAGTSLDAHLDHEALTTLASHWWHDGSQLELDASIDVSAKNIAAFAGEHDATGYRRFCDDSRAIHDTLRDTFMAAQKPTPLSLPARVGWRKLNALLNTRPQQTLWRALEDYFDDERLRQLFGRYATYVGSSPLKTPATLMLIAHVEQDGVWRLPGGMASLAASMAGLAEAQGTIVRLDTPVERINMKNGRVSGVTLAEDEQLPADAVVFNGDVAALGAGLLGDDVARRSKAIARKARGLSAITWSGLADAGDFPLGYHNVFFDRDYPTEFSTIFTARQVPARPTVYICAQDRQVPGPRLASAGPERMLILICAPADGDIPGAEQDGDKAWEWANAVLKSAGLNLSLDPRSENRTPQWYAARYPASGGSLYGTASHGMWSSFTRPGARSPIGGLYLCGGSTHPGPGVPMATLSGRLAAQAVTADLH